MKTRLIILRIVSTTPLILLAFLPIMSDSFLWQYGSDGGPARYGSRYEIILYVIIPVIIGWFFHYWLSKCKLSEKNSKFISALATTIIISFQALLTWVLINGIIESNLTTYSNNKLIIQLPVYFIGVLLIFYGNQIPRASFGSNFGFKNIWSLSSEKIWIHSQKWVGVLFIICGTGIIFLAVAFGQSNIVLVLLFPITVLVAGSYALSYKAYRMFCIK
ncbi:hypothetical protein [Enterococcus sp. LJL51]|uniref:hypothetical protein n=1 Tax=Enterococcus sp. LJL51 TaxID=3416656 RepID=UPI003CF860D2